MASHNVHANPKGVLFRLGLLPSKQDILLAGPSNSGLTDPAHGTAISLLQSTISLLTLNPNFDKLVMCNVLIRIEREIGVEFLKVQQIIEDESLPNY